MEEYFDGEYVLGSKRVGEEVELAPGLVGILEGQKVGDGYIAIDLMINRKVITIDSRGGRSEDYFAIGAFVYHIVGRSFSINCAPRLMYTAYREEMDPVDATIVLRSSKGDSCRFCNSKEYDGQSPWLLSGQCGPVDTGRWINGECVDPIASRIHSKEYNEDVLRVGDRFIISIGSDIKIKSSPGLLITKEDYSPNGDTAMIEFKALRRGNKYITMLRNGREIETKYYRIV